MIRFNLNLRFLFATTLMVVVSGFLFYNPSFVDALSYEAGLNYETGGNPESVFAADLDNDGDIDLVTVAPGSNTVSILKNNGDGTFQTFVNYETGDGPHSVFAADLDNDGDKDLATANSHSNTVSILINNGDGTFQKAVNYEVTGGIPYSVFAADLDNDGDIDLAVANDYQINTVSILKNNGDGTFQTNVSYGVGNGLHSVFAADLDNDGDTDLAVTNSYYNNVSILKNNGDGTFQPAVNYGVGYSPHSVFAADLDNDGDIDLVTANFYGSISILKNNGDGTFQPAVDSWLGYGPLSVFAADLDNDGDKDLATAGFNSYTYVHKVSILINNGNGTFQPAVNYGAGTHPHSVFAADLDIDGDIDLAVANYSSHNVSILFSRLLNNPPVLSFPTTGPYADGIDPNTGTANATPFFFKVIFTNMDNDPPTNLRVVVYNGGTATSTLFMSPDTDVSISPELHDGNYQNGEEYTVASLFPKGNYSYIFETIDTNNGGQLVLFPIATTLTFTVSATSPNQSPTWTTLDPPGATYDIQLNGISGNNIVGTYKGPSGGLHNFLYNGISWTTLNMPGAAYTIPSDIDGNNIVGYYWNGPNVHGFLYNGTSWTTLDMPGAVNTHPLGISGNNIIGTYDDAYGHYHNFLYDGTNWTTLDMPGLPGATLKGISGNNIVGIYFNVSHNQNSGFLYNGTSWTTLDMPGAIATNPMGIDGSNIVGYFDPQHGFLYNGTSWTTLDMPGTTYTTIPKDISGNNIVGTYLDASNYQHGFLYTMPSNNPPTETATITVIKHVINDNGGTAVAGDWTIFINATNPSNYNFPGEESPGVTITVDVGDYGIGEEGGPSGYTKSLSEDCSGTIALGETKTCTITNDDIASENQPPVASFTFQPENPKAGEEILFDASSSYDPDPDGSIVSYEWDWDDDGAYDDSLESATVSMQWPLDGSFTVRLRVIDNNGAEAVFDLPVLVSDTPKSDLAAFIIFAFRDAGNTRLWQNILFDTPVIWRLFPSYREFRKIDEWLREDAVGNISGVQLDWLKRDQRFEEFFQYDITPADIITLLHEKIPGTNVNYESRILTTISEYRMADYALLIAKGDSAKGLEQAIGTFKELARQLVKWVPIVGELIVGDSTVDREVLKETVKVGTRIAAEEVLIRKGFEESYAKELSGSGVNLAWTAYKAYKGLNDLAEFAKFQSYERRLSDYFTCSWLKDVYSFGDGDCWEYTVENDAISQVLEDEDKQEFEEMWQRYGGTEFTCPEGVCSKKLEELQNVVKIIVLDALEQHRNKLPDRLHADANSPVEVRVIDSYGVITGVVDGIVRENIPRSVYDGNEEAVTIILPPDNNLFQLVGTADGTYGFVVTSVQEGTSRTFRSIDIPTNKRVVHQYSIDWNALSQGEKGVTLQIDADGDGVFEQTVTADNDLTYDEFILQTETIIDFDPNTLNLKGKGKFVTVYIELPEGFDVNQIDVSSIILNNVVPALSQPSEIGDYDSDGIPDLMVKFDRSNVQSILGPGEEVPLTLAGKVFHNGSYINLNSSDVIRVIEKENRK